MLYQVCLISQPPSTKHLNILVVDDEFGTRASLGIVLALAGHHAVFANDGDEALKMVDEGQVAFDLIITDHAMVRVSGLDLVRGLRERGFKGQIVVLTAYAGTIEEDEYKKLQVAGGHGEAVLTSRNCATGWIACTDATTIRRRTKMPSRPGRLISAG